MWVPSKVLELLSISKDSVDSLRSALAAANSELTTLRTQSVADKANMDWLRIRVNALEMENKALLEKAYDIRLPAPQIVRAPNQPIDPQREASIFDDIGEDLARVLGMPSHTTLPPAP